MRKALLFCSLFASAALSAQFNVTFQVGMNYQTVGPNGVHIAGNFQAAAGFPGDWDPSTTEMTDANGDGIYEVTVSLPAGDYQFKYVNGNAWGSDESVPAGCLVGGNRGVTVAGDMTVGPVCYGECTPCATGLTFRVDMSTQTVSPNGVHVAGNFQAAAGFPGDWDPATTEMTDLDADGIYEVTVNVPDGNYSYKFVNGNAWGTDEAVPGACAVNGNRSVDVVGGIASPATVCFGLCGPCIAVVPVDVTFRVDMNGVANVPDTIHVAGNFQGWNPGATMMTDPDQDGIYEGTVDNVLSGTYQYKYVNGNQWGEDEAIPCACSSAGNREIAIPNTDTVYSTPIVCFGNCGPCSPDFVNVIFRLDLDPNIIGALPGDSIAVKVFAPFPIEYTLTNTVGTLYESSAVPLAQGAYVYEFRNDAYENSNGIDPCGCEYFGGDKRRSLDIQNIAGGTTYLTPAYYFELCSFSEDEQIITGVGSISGLRSFSVSPNPFGTETVVNFTNDNGSTYGLSLSTLTGQVVKQMGNITGNQAIISRDGLAAGMYFLTLQNDRGERVSQKVIIE